VLRTFHIAEDPGNFSITEATDSGNDFDQLCCWLL